MLKSIEFQLNLMRVKRYKTACSPCIGPTTTTTTISKITILSFFVLFVRTLKVSIAFEGSKKSVRKDLSEVEVTCDGDSLMKNKAYKNAMR